MTILVYTGTSDVREFSAADLRKHGVEDAKKVSFRRGEPVEVEDQAVVELFTDGDLQGEHIRPWDEDTDVEKLLAKTQRVVQPDVPVVTPSQSVGPVTTTGGTSTGGSTPGGTGSRGSTGTGPTTGARGRGRASST